MPKGMSVYWKLAPARNNLPHSSVIHGEMIVGVQAADGERQLSGK